jgi:phosphoenolpyruvate-protein kinase (PTS system EI component)
MSAVDVSGYVLVPIERLRALEALEAEIPAIIAKTRAESDKERLTRLHAKAKENPKESSEKALKRYYKNKDEINARRREAYRVKKEAAKITDGTT